MPPLFYGRVSKDFLPIEKSEDNWAIHTDSSINIVALSDGAGTAAFSRQWASVLTKWSVQHPVEVYSEIEVFEWLRASSEGLYQTWRDSIPPYEDLPYYGQNRLNEGSQATLLVAQIESQFIQAFGIGDTCLFHVRNGELQNSFPVSSSKDFDISPALLHTSAEIFPHPEGNIHIFHAETLPLDHIFFATDALACWILRQVEKEEPVWDKLLSVRNDNDLKELVCDLRERKSIRNDDVTLVSLRITDKFECESDKEN